MAWGYKATITIDKDLCGTADSSNFPFLLSGTYDGTGGEPDLRVTGSGGKITDSNGYDIGFYSDANLTQALKYERQSHNTTTGAVVYWVKIPTLTYASDTVIYMAYGDSGVTTDQQDAANTWTNYSNVWHLDTLNDSKGGITLTNSGASSTSVKIGNGYSFASGNYMTFSSLVTLQTEYSVEMWVNNPVNIPTRYSGNTNNFLYWRTAPDWTFCDNAGSWEVLISGAHTGLHHWIFTVKTGSTTYGYKDGGAATGSCGSKSSYLVDRIGTYPSFAWVGGLDEIRFGTSQFSASYVLANYNTMNSPSTFYTMSSESATNNAPDTPTNSTPIDTATNQNRQLTLTGSAYHDTEDDAHTASQWQIATDSGMSSVVWDSGETATNKTSIVVNSTNGTFAGALSGKSRLAANTQYYWHVKYKD